MHPQLLTKEALESFRDFEMKMYSEYQQMQQQYEFTVIEGDQSIAQVQTILRRATMRRPHFGEILHNRQHGMEQNMEAMDRHATPLFTTFEADPTEGHTKVKKTKGKK